MTRRISRRWHLVTLGALLLILLGRPAAGDVQAAGTTLFSGRATVVNGKVLGLPLTLADTGPVAPEGGALQATLLCYPGAGCAINVPDQTSGALQAKVLHAAVVSQGNASHADASVAEFTLSAAGQTISAEFLRSEAEARCNGSKASVTGSAEVVDLVINGQRIAVTGQANQIVSLPGGGAVIINEQVASASGNRGDSTVSALHIKLPAVVPGTETDLVVAQAHADIVCASPPPCNRDFITGGGFILSNDGTKRHFAVAGGLKNGYWGHLVYMDRAVDLKVKGTGVTAYTATGATSRHIDGTAESNGVPGIYAVDVADNGEPGRGSDSFKITLSTGYSAAGPLAGGNIQLHTCK